MKREGVWGLITSNLFDEACKNADIEYEATKSMFVLRNKVYALLHLKKYQDVITLAKQLIEFRKGDTSSDFESLGIAYWAIREFAVAIDTWSRAQNSIYQDAAGGIEVQVYLYFAAVKTGQDKLKALAIKQIKKLLRSKRATNWPGPMGDFLLDNISEKEMLSYVVEIPILKERQLCEANFVAAIKQLEVGNTDEYYKNLKKCLSLGVPAYLEFMYYLAMIELDNV